ncbi:MAG: hypothetical protein R3C32_10005 [Chloroflexota bacterium]
MPIGRGRLQEAWWTWSDEGHPVSRRPGQADRRGPTSRSSEGEAEGTALVEAVAEMDDGLMQYLEVRT